MTGLTIRRNPKNKFVVATLYYFANPQKRSVEYKEELKQQMGRDAFLREFEIMYDLDPFTIACKEAVEERVLD